MRQTINSRRDLRNWVDSHTSNWADRTAEDVEQLTDTLRQMNHPEWGADWSEWLENLPELTELLNQQKQ